MIILFNTVLVDKCTRYSEDGKCMKITKELLYTLYNKIYIINYYKQNRINRF